MKLSILTEGGKDIGFGHITRCLSLFQAVKEKNIIPLLLVNADESAKYLLKGTNCELFNWLKERDRLLDRIDNADVVIIDSYLADISLYIAISKLVKRAVYIDDNNRLNYPKGIVVNSSIFAEEISYPINGDVTYLLGTEYAPLRKEFWGASERVINKKPKNVLVTFGGMEYSNFIQKLVSYFKGRFDFIFTVTDDKNRVGAKKMLSLMLQADLCISGGGQTTYELARCGVPTIGICFADNQLINLEGWAKTGFLEFVGWYEKKSLFKKIEKDLIRVSSYKKRIEINRIGRKFVDGQGAKRVTQEMLK